jgi:hypothetical protein
MISRTASHARDNLTTTSPALRYEQARRRAIRLRHFYVHCLAFLACNTANLTVNLITRQSGNDWWFQWVLIPWSVALAIHALTLVSQGTWLGPVGVERKIRRYVGEEDPLVTPGSPPATVPDSSTLIQTNSGQSLQEV